MINIKEKHKFFLKNIFIFLFFASIFSLIQFSSLNLAGFDAYYHIKYAYLYRTLGIEETLNNFSLGGEYSLLNQYPSDLSFLYHIFLIPFTYGNLIINNKIAVIILAALILTLFYWVLRKNNIKYAFFWTLLFFASASSFISRLLLARPLLLSIIFLILGFYLIIKKKYIWLFVLSIFYTLSYAVFPLLLVISFLYILAEFIQLRKIDWRLLLVPLLGIFLGLIIRPDFPQSLSVIFVQDFLTLFYNFQGNILNIAEMSSISGVMINNLILFLLFSISLAFFIIDIIEKRINRNKLSVIRLNTFFLSSLFFVLTIASQRFFEYWTPFAFFFAAFSFKQISQNAYWKNSILLFKKRTKKTFLKIKFSLCFSLVLIIISGSTINIIQSVDLISEKSLPFAKYQEAGEWLEKNTPAKSIIFNAGWDNFPQLFFYNHHNNYLVGKDPTFMYVYNKELFWFWNNLVNCGLICSQPLAKCPEASYVEKISQRAKKASQIIREKFKSEYIFVDNQKIEGQINRYAFLEKILAEPSLFEKVYQSNEYEEVTIYHILAK